ncbi:hypothetical protein VTG60DRAFT_2146 [Thermothelomyces hinnuleus]
MEHDAATAETLDISQYATHGFCPDYPLLRHRYESLANAGCLEARKDWARYIGPAGEFGGCNPFDGNFTALVLPLCKPERLRLVAYVIEYAFLHDTIVEGVESEHLNETDKVCAARVMDSWKTMLSTTLRDKAKNFSDLEEYLDFRIIDTGTL